MSETFNATRTGFQKLRVAWAGASFDRKIEVFWWGFGWILMIIAVLSWFGWHGFMFMFGLLLMKAMNEPTP